MVPSVPPTEKSHQQSYSRTALQARVPTGQASNNQLFSMWVLGLFLKVLYTGQSLWLGRSQLKGGAGEDKSSSCVVLLCGHDIKLPSNICLYPQHRAALSLIYGSLRLYEMASNRESYLDKVLRTNDD